MTSFLLFCIGAVYSADVIKIKTIPIISGIVVMSIGLLFFLKLVFDTRRLYKSFKSVSEVYNNDRDVIISTKNKDILRLQKTYQVRELIYVQLFFIIIIGALAFLELFYLIKDYVTLGFPLTMLLITSSALTLNISLLGSSVFEKQVYNESEDEKDFGTAKVYRHVNKAWHGLKVFFVFGILYIIHVLLKVVSGVT